MSSEFIQSCYLELKARGVKALAEKLYESGLPIQVALALMQVCLSEAKRGA